MNKIRELLRKIMGMLDSSDLTNTEERRKLVEEYCAVCEEYDRTVSECQTLMERQMVAEAAALAEKKSLLEIGPLLQFRERALLLDMCKMYADWPSPAEIRTDIVQDLFKKAAGSVDITRLVAQYRQVMRSDNFQEKVQLLRKICKKDPKQDWKDTLAAAEKGWLKELLDQAKDAIVREDVAQIQFYYGLLNSSAWSVKIPDVVLKKLQGLVEKYHQEDLERRAETLCGQIGDALSAFDFDAMSYSIEKWDTFVREESYEVPGHLATQVDNARTWYTEESVRRAKAKEAERLIAGLQTALENSDAALDELDGFVQKLEMMEWEIPQGIRNRYQVLRTQILAAEARKRRIVIVSASAAAVLILSLSGWGIYTVIMDRNEKAWLAKIEGTLKDKEPERGLKLLGELEKKSPAIRRRVSVLEAENKLNKLKEEQDGQRKLFAEQVALCREQLPEYSKNRNVVDELSSKVKTLVLDAQMKQEYEKLVSEIDVAKTEALQELEREYTRDIEKIDELRKDFFMALDEENLENARKCIVESEKLKSKLLSMKEVTKKVRDMNQKTLESVSEMEPLLVKNTERMKRLNRLRQKIRSPESFGSFIEALKELSRDFYEKPEKKTWQNFMEVYLSYAEKIDQGDNTVLKGFGQLSGRVKSEEEKYTKVLTDLKKDFSQRDEEYKEDPIYCILAEDVQQKGIIYGLYYSSTTKLKPKNIDETIRFYALKNEVVPGKISQYAASICFPTGITKLKEGGSFKCGWQQGQRVQVTLLYPNEFGSSELPKRNALAPHTVLVRWIAEKLKTAANKDLEPVLIQSLQKIFAEDRKLHPFPRLSLARDLSKALAEISEDKQAVKLADNLERIFKDLDFDWDKSWMENTEKPVRVAWVDAKDWVKAAAETAGKLKVSARHLNLEFAEAFLKQQFSGAGYLIREDDGWHFVRVNNDLVNKELYILSPDLSQFEFFGLYPQCVQDIQIVREEKIIPVFALMSNSLRSLEEKFQARAKQSGCTLEYPACWPIKSGEGK